MTTRPTEGAISVGEAIDTLIRTLKDLDADTRATVLLAACSHLKITLPSVVTSHPATGTAVPGPEPLAEQSSVLTDIRSLKDKKEPKSANEMAAVVAFYLAELAPLSDRRAEVGQKDMIKYFKQAGFKLPKNPRVLLHNAAAAGYFDTLGDGLFRLNPVGYNLVAYALPRGASSLAAPRRRSRAKSRRRHSRR
jgi:hypothetical protein